LSWFEKIENQEEARNGERGTK
jgi:hypothetical protein